MNVKIKRLSPDIPLPQYQTAGSVGFDLSVKEDMTLAPREIKLARTGLVVCTPPGYAFAIVSRSSLPMKKGITLANCVGIVDQDYCGPEDEVLIQLLNLKDEPVMILKGERVAQGIFVKIDKAEWEEIDNLGDKSRGGVGSTGGYNS